MSAPRVRLVTHPETGGPPDLRVDGRSIPLEQASEIRLVMNADDVLAELRVVYRCQGVDVVGSKVRIRHVCPIRGTL